MNYARTQKNATRMYRIKLDTSVIAPRLDALAPEREESFACVEAPPVLSLIARIILSAALRHYSHISGHACKRQSGGFSTRRSSWI